MKTIKITNYSVLKDKIFEYARKAGRTMARILLQLYFVMTSEETPRKDKLLIVSALSYLVLPIDLIDAKKVPILGWFDEMASLYVAYQKVRQHITPEMEAKVDKILDSWFPEQTEHTELSS